MVPTNYIIHLTERQLEAQIAPLREALSKAKTFIEYARYELEPGEAKLGHQFPNQGDADKVLALIVEALDGNV